MILALWLAAQLSLPNPSLTPGVTRALTTEQVCTMKWGKDHRFVTLAMKKAVFAAYGIPWAQHACCEVDHLVPRSEGGADDIKNLWPQPWPEARLKDKEERRLHREVCAGRMTLLDAQRTIRAWGHQSDK